MAATPAPGRLRRLRDVCFCCGRRCALIAAVVGTVLTAINEGDVLLRGDLQGSLGWKIPLNYLVPFAVPTVGYRTAGR